MEKTEIPFGIWKKHFGEAHRRYSEAIVLCINPERRS